MPVIRSLYNTFLDAIFPIPEAESAVLSMGNDLAWKTLPRAERVPVPEACSVFSYKDERVRRLIWSVKYKKSASGSAIAGYALYRVLQLFSTAVPRVMVVPMPITGRRRRERGFNQCELIADKIEELATNDMLSIEVTRDLLIRKKHTSRQTLKDRAERLGSVQGIFAVNPETAERIKSNDQMGNDSMIVIIDDVITTGGTIKDAIETLRRAGFERTWGLSVAH